MVYFVTSNESKVEEAEAYLSGIEPVEQINYDYTEIQHHDLAEIAVSGAREAYDELGREQGVLVDDTGLFIDALEGFPGPYSAYVEDTVGVERVWKLAATEDNRRAHFRTVLAYADETGVETFEGSVAGTLVPPRGTGGFGYNPIFEYNGQTMAEMSTDEKNAISHRGRALEAFAEWFASN